MSSTIAVISDDDGGIIARCEPTPNKDHDYEIRLMSEIDRIHIFSTPTITERRIREEATEFFESVGDSYSNINFSVEMN